MIRAEITISGHVQGVGFRFSAEQEANKLDLRGFIKNLPNNKVFTVVEGEVDKVEEYINWCCRGSKWAEVEKCDVRRLNATGEFNKFEIIF